MSEKNEEVKDIKRDRNKETMQEISDNTRAIEDLQYEYEEKLDEIKKLGYKESFINYDKKDGKEIPLKIVICKEKDIPVGSYTLDDGLELKDSRAMELLELANNWEKEKEEEQRQRQSNDSNKNNKDEKSEDEKKKPEEAKEEENKGELTKEEIQEQLGDKFVVAEIINDEEISKALIGSEGFTGNPMVAYNKEEKRFVIVGNRGGKIEQAKLPTMPASTGKVKRYNSDGSIINEEKGNVSNELLLINGGKDGIELGVSDYGEIILNKQLNVNDINQESIVSVPIDTNQKVPTTKEIQEMKVKSEKTDKVNQKLDDMEKEGIISKAKRQELEEKFASDGKSPEENMEELKNIEKQKQTENEKHPEAEEEYDDSWFIYGKPRSH